MLLGVEKIQAQSKTTQPPIEERKKKSETEIKENTKLLETRSDKAMELYMATPVAPNQANNEKNNEKRKQATAQPK